MPVMMKVVGRAQFSASFCKCKLYEVLGTGKEEAISEIYFC